MMRWRGYTYTHPLRFARKKDNPQPNHYAVRRIDFGLEGWSWCAFDASGRRVVMPNGTFALVHEARLHRSGHVIGLRDLATCDHYGDPVLTEEWRGSLADTISHEMEINAGE